MTSHRRNCNTALSSATAGMPALPYDLQFLCCQEIAGPPHRAFGPDQSLQRKGSKRKRSEFQGHAPIQTGRVISDSQDLTKTIKNSDLCPKVEISPVASRGIVACEGSGAGTHAVDRVEGTKNLMETGEIFRRHRADNVDVPRHERASVKHRRVAPDEHELHLTARESGQKPFEIRPHRRSSRPAFPAWKGFVGHIHHAGACVRGA